MIVFDSITKQFGPDSYGVVDVSFTIDPGEFVILTGSSGAGKTTLMRLMTKEYTPTNGDIFFEDLELNKIPVSKVHVLRRRIGVVFQDYRLLPELNVWENIALPLYIINQSQHEIEERVTDLLKLIGLTDKADLFPSQLSGGEAQRVSIARALAMGPSVIFADEPTGNLDTETSHTIAKLLHKINSLGTTVVIATHDPTVLDLFTNERHLHLEGGKLMSDSSDASKKKSKASSSATETTDKADEKSARANQADEKSETRENKREKDSAENATTDSNDAKDTTDASTEEKTSFWSKLMGKGKKVAPRDVDGDMTEEDDEDIDDDHDEDEEVEDSADTELHVEIDSLDEKTVTSTTKSATKSKDNDSNTNSQPNKNQKSDNSDKKSNKKAKK